MAESDQPKKETVRIELPLPSLTNPPQPMVEPRETVRIQLPVRGTDGSPFSSQPSPEDISPTNLFPPPNPPVASKPLSAAVRPAPASPLRERKEIPSEFLSIRSHCALLKKRLS